MTNSSKGKDIERKNVILSAMQKYDSVSDKPEKGKEIELKSCPLCLKVPTVDSFKSEDLATHNIVDWHRVSCSCYVGPEYSIPDGYHGGSAVEVWNTRQSPQINIDEITGVIESLLKEESLIEFVSGGILDHNQAANLIAQAIASHLNGKGDGDE